MSILTDTDRATADRVWHALGNRERVLNLANNAGLRRITVHATAECALVTVATLDDLYAWRQELDGTVAFADGPTGFRTATLTTAYRTVEVRVGVMYPAGAEDENWHEQYALTAVAS